MDIIQFKKKLQQLLFAETNTATYTPSQADLDAIQKLVKTKYQTWEWNFGNNPNSKIQQTHQFPDGIVEIYLEVEKGYIKFCRVKINLHKAESGEIEKQLENIRYTPTDVQNALRGLNLEKTLGSISIESLAQWIMSY